jgi:predicted nuclease of predicted toxin-antitoxin system
LSLLTSSPINGGKLLLVRTGNLRTRELKARFERHRSEIMAALEQNSLVELDRQTVRVIG